MMQRRPNLVFLLADDLRWNTLGCMGDTIVRTPNIDRLAREGTLFENAFVTTSICVASRASILTGQWSRRHGIEDFAKPFRAEAWANTYPALLRTAGYRTGFVGKFGVGNDKAVAAMESQFDFWRGLPGQGGANYIVNGVHRTAQFGEEMREFIATNNSDKPFCLSVSFNAPHARDGKPREFEPDPRDEALYADTTFPIPALASAEAFQRLPEAVQKSEGRRRWEWRFDTSEKFQRTLRDYYRLVTGIDREVGRLLEVLPQNTVVVFHSDNGFAFGERGLADKWFAYEEDIRVPLIAWGPGVRRGERRTDFALNVDIAPTLLDLAGVSIPAAMQGKSLLPILSGTTGGPKRDDFFYEHHSVPEKIPPVEALRTDRYKYIRWLRAGKDGADVEEMYDLRDDPQETRNLIASPTHSALLGRLRERYRSEAERLR
jgi:arylsulfatase A-like enzyme